MQCRHKDRRLLSFAGRLGDQLLALPVIGPILDNPIAVREWRILWRKASDWRIWVGLRWPREPTVWGAPVVLTYALGPFGMWAVLALLRRAHLMPAAGLPVDPFFLLALVFWIYVVVISLVLGATAVTYERARQTWDDVRVTLLNGRERVAGFLWGRLGPVWISFGLTAGLWWLSLPIGSRWLAPGIRPVIPRHLLIPVEIAICYLSALAGELGLLASGRCKSSLVAIVLAALMVAPFALVIALVVAAVMITGGDMSRGIPVNERARQTGGILVILGFFFSLLAVIRKSLASRMDVP